MRPDTVVQGPRGQLQLSEAELRVGRQVAAHLLRGMPVRRTDSIDVSDAEWIRREIGVDFTVPRLQRSSVVPLFLLPRSPGRAMDFRFRVDGAPVPLPSRELNAYMAFLALAATAFRELGSAIEERLLETLALIAAGPYDDSPLIAKRLRQGRLVALSSVPCPEPLELAMAGSELGRPYLGAQTDDRVPIQQPASAELRAAQLAVLLAGDVANLVDVLAQGSPVCVRVDRPEQGRQRRATLEFLEPLRDLIADPITAAPATTSTGVAPIRMSVLLPPGNRAASLHVEVNAPPGMEITRATLHRLGWDESDPTTPLAMRGGSHQGSRAHLYPDTQATLEPVALHVELRVRRSFPRLISLLSILVTAVLFVAAKRSGVLMEQASTSAGIVVALPGLLLLIAGRSTGHELADHALGWPRRALLLQLPLLMAVAIPLGFMTGPEQPDEIPRLLPEAWFTAAGLSGVLTAYVFAACVLPGVKRWQRRASRVWETLAAQARWLARRTRERWASVAVRGATQPGRDAEPDITRGWVFRRKWSLRRTYVLIPERRVGNALLHYSGRRQLSPRAARALHEHVQRLAASGTPTEVEIRLSRTRRADPSLFADWDEFASAVRAGDLTAPLLFRAVPNYFPRK